MTGEKENLTTTLRIFPGTNFKKREWVMVMRVRRREEKEEGHNWL